MSRRTIGIHCHVLLIYRSQLASDSAALAVTGPVGFSLAADELDVSQATPSQPSQVTSAGKSVSSTVPSKRRMSSRTTSEGTKASSGAVNPSKRAKTSEVASSGTTSHVESQTGSRVARKHISTARNSVGKAKSSGKSKQDMPERAGSRPSQQSKTPFGTKDSTATQSSVNADPAIHLHSVAQESSEQDTPVEEVRPLPKDGAPPREERSTSPNKDATTSHHGKVSALEKLKRLLALCDSFGMRSLENDVLRTRSWVLASSSGAYTEDHQDAAGYFTWAECQTGKKLWCYLTPNNVSQDVASAAKTFEGIIEDAMDTDTFGRNSRPVSLILTPGTIL